MIAYGSHELFMRLLPTQHFKTLTWLELKQTQEKDEF